ncbi:hypothetical protein [Maribacter spongiicola]|uniref:hypothetical protein n=1 Tax=Maribacter spongiicola TaxID=1206753 RepID=UPI00105CC9CF|nr:hypothetical protein [Maribacter spongiicola]
MRIVLSTYGASTYPKITLNNYTGSMQHLNTYYHPTISSLEKTSIFTRLATRSIAVKGVCYPD